MAKDFDSASSEFLSASAVLTGPPVCVSAFFRATSSAATQMIFSLNDTGSDNNRFNLYLRTTGNVAVNVRTTNSSIVESSTAYSTADVWEHAGMACASTTSRFALHQGVKGTEDTGSQSVSGIDGSAIGCSRQASNTNFFDGALAQIGVWNADLDDDEWLALADGVSPLLIRPQSLVSYVPLIGGVNTDYVADRAWTDQGTPAATADHPPARMPANSMALSTTAATPPVGSPRGGLTLLGVS